MAEDKKFDLVMWRIHAADYIQLCAEEIDAAQKLVVDLRVPEIFARTLVTAYKLRDPQLAEKTYVSIQDLAHQTISVDKFALARQRNWNYQKRLFESEARDFWLKNFAISLPKKLTEQRMRKIARNDMMHAICYDLSAFHHELTEKFATYLAQANESSQTFDFGETSGGGNKRVIKFQGRPNEAFHQIIVDNDVIRYEAISDASKTAMEILRAYQKCGDPEKVATGFKDWADHLTVKNIDHFYAQRLPAYLRRAKKDASPA